MQYSVCVATDCDGKKVNLRFLFDSYGPSVARLLNRCIIAFNNLFQLRSIHRTFAVSAAVVFNDVHNTWDRLERSTQLLHNSQVYLFQPDTLDLPAEIPEPFEGHPLLGDGYVSPQRERSTSPRPLGPARYDSRPATILESPPGAPGRERRSLIRGIGNGVPLRNHYYEVLEDGGGQSTLAATPNRNGNRDLLDRGQTQLLKQSVNSTSLSPPARQPRETNLRSRSRSRSILRDEREKIEYQMRLPLDEMRHFLKEETRQMERSISPVRNKLVN